MMLPGHEVTVHRDKAHPGRDWLCQRYTVKCSCGWEQTAGVDDATKVKAVKLEHRLDCIEAAIAETAALGDTGTPEPNQRLRDDG